MMPMTHNSATWSLKANRPVGENCSWISSPPWTGIPMPGVGFIGV
jgi:hypothetical protein